MSNVNKGDLAVFRAGSVNAGALCVVLEHGVQPFGDWQVKLLSHAKSVSGAMQSPGFIGFADDRALRPIRDSDGTDEILRKVGKPKSNVMAPRRQVEFSR